MVLVNFLMIAADIFMILATFKLQVDYFRKIEVLFDIGVFVLRGGAF